jgi:hypothetical protein
VITGNGIINMRKYTITILIIPILLDSIAIIMSFIHVLFSHTVYTNPGGVLIVSGLDFFRMAVLLLITIIFHTLATIMSGICIIYRNINFCITYIYIIGFTSLSYAIVMFYWSYTFISTTY